jgi:hypothetical protein
MKAHNITKERAKFLQEVLKITIQYKPIYIGNTSKLSVDDNKTMSLGLHDELQEVQVFIIIYYLLF